MTLETEQQQMLLLLGWLKLQCGQPGQARTLLEALLYAHPDHRQGRRALVVALLQMGEGALAAQRCQALLADGEREPAIWLCISRALQLEGRMEEARAAYQRFLNRQVTHETTL